MCNQPNCNHDDLNDDLSDLGGFAPVEFAKAALSNATSLRTFETQCPSCRGSGTFRSYTGRVVGDCFKCKGQGVIRTKTDPKVLEANRAKAAEKRAAEARRVAEQAAAWKLEHADEFVCLTKAASRGFEFAQSMLEAVGKYGRLTERQFAAVSSMVEKSKAREAQWAAERAEREANKADVQIEHIAEAFAAAKASRLKWPKLRLDTFVFSLASESGRNAGAIYVKQDETYLGKIDGGKFTRSRDCDADTEARIIAACADPAAAATAYGKATGQCSCCGRELTNEESIALGIGPICKERFGW